MSKMTQGADIDDDAFKYVEAIIFSMTPAERERPEILSSQRRKRIAVGSGRDIAEVNRLIKQFEDTKKMMKMMGNRAEMGKMMQRMKNIPGMGGL
jgi:signal recognition particle subunit SRP54